jgi:glycosyltransferase involved in cell wall biosynthesis
MIAHGLEVWYRLTPMQKWALRRVGRILSVSAYTRSRIAALAPGVPPDLMEIFPNAVSSDFSRKPASSATDRGTEKISPRFYLTVSRLDRRERAKGILTLLEAMSGLEDDRIRLVVAGDGNDRAFLMQVAERLGLANRVKWIGSVDDATLLDLYSRCTAFVLPSCQEGFGIVYLEAMRCGAPVIAAREKGVVDVVMHRETGLLVEFGDVVGLMAAMSEIDRDALLRVRVRKAALAQVTGRGRFTYAAFKERWSTTLFHGAGVTKLSYKSTSI